MMRNIIVHEVGERGAVHGGHDAGHGARDGGRRRCRHRQHDHRGAHRRQQPGALPLPPAPTWPWSPRRTRFTAGGRTLRGRVRSSSATPIAARVEPLLRELGLSGYAVGALPAVQMHDLDMPRIGYMHSWTNTQDEGWVRAALDHYGVPYTYFGENEVRKIASLRAALRRDPLAAWRQRGAGRAGRAATRSRISARPSIPTSASPTPPSDTRGGLGADGLQKLHEFVQAGGTLITEGNTAAIFPTYSLTPGLRTTSGAGAGEPRHAAARRDRRHEEPRRVRLRREPAADLLQRRHPARCRCARDGGCQAGEHRGRAASRQFGGALRRGASAAVGSAARRQQRVPEHHADGHVGGAFAVGPDAAVARAARSAVRPRPRPTFGRFGGGGRAA